MAHTPGPWFVADWGQDNGPNLCTIEARSKEVLRPGETGIWPGGIKKHRVASTEECDNPLEDARLIAAAPEMYDFLRHMRDVIPEGAFEAVWGKETVGALDAILTKVETSD